jgi:hypothetical protein
MARRSMGETTGGSQQYVIFFQIYSDGAYLVDNPKLAEIKQKWDRSGLDMADLLTTSSRDPQLSLAFNYASLLMNNSFFLEGLVSGTVYK